MKTIRNAVHDMVQDNEPGVYSNFLFLPYSHTISDLATNTVPPKILDRDATCNT
jgi:hypothetical protein